MACMDQQLGGLRTERAAEARSEGRDCRRPRRCRSALPADGGIGELDRFRATTQPKVGAQPATAARCVDLFSYSAFADHEPQRLVEHGSR